MTSCMLQKSFSVRLRVSNVARGKICLAWSSFSWREALLKCYFGWSAVYAFYLRDENASEPQILLYILSQRKAEKSRGRLYQELLFRPQSSGDRAPVESGLFEVPCSFLRWFPVFCRVLSSTSPSFQMLFLWVPCAQFRRGKSSI